VAQAVAEHFSPAGKPVLGCWMGDASVRKARQGLERAQLPIFRTPEAAVDAFHSIASFYRNQQLLQQTPPPLSELAEPDTEGARLLIEGVLAERRKVLTEMESKALLAAFHIPVTRTMLARSANEAMLIASQLGYPVALKIDSPDISHKSDVQGVVLGVVSAAQVRDAYNDMLAAVRRAQPGGAHQRRHHPAHGRAGARARGLCRPDHRRPVRPGDHLRRRRHHDRAGGRPRDGAAAAEPVPGPAADRALRVYTTLGEWRGAPPADIEALERVLLRVSEMVCALPQLREMDINPIIVDDTGAVAVDARIVIDHAPQAPGAYNHLAILPYPTTHEREWPMKGGDLYTIRPIRPDDADMLQALVRGLSEESRYFRFASAMPELPARMLARYTLIDYDREMALVAVHKERHADDGGGVSERERIIGVSRYITNPDQTSCEFSLVVADDFKGQGLGSRLMLSIIDAARAKGLAEIVGLILANNTNMLRLMASLGFTIAAFPEDPDFKLARPCSGAGAPAAATVTAGGLAGRPARALALRSSCAARRSISAHSAGSMRSRKLFLPGLAMAMDGGRSGYGARSAGRRRLSGSAPRVGHRRSPAGAAARACPG
jgi:acetyltransferase